MKKSTQFFFLILLVIFCPILVLAQNQCAGSFKEYVLNSNNIRASFFPRGNKFTDGSQGGFLVPYPSKERLTTIFASSPWIGGYDDAGNLKLAVETYPGTGTNDFSVGPLSSIGTIVDSTCGKFDQAWTVYYEDIRNHILDYNQNSKIDRPIASIFHWPGRGNKFFLDYYGFELPDDNQGLAPFHDANGNNRYDPDKGDYPVVRISGYEYIPDQMLWMVFNDVDTNYNSGHKPLRFEIQLTAFAFHCQDNEILNNTIFNSYKIIDRAVSVIDSVFFGMWTDYDLGCYLDDAIGTDSSRSTEFVYNADDRDGDVGMNCSNGANTYASHVPVQSMTYLNYPMNSAISASRQLKSPIEFYRQLNGQWHDGTPLTPEGSGYNPGSGLSPTKFIFNGDPRDSSGWSALEFFPHGDDQKIVSSVSLGRMDPGQVREVLTAYMFHYDSTLDRLGQIALMYSDIDSLFFLLNNHDLACTPFPICNNTHCVWPGDFDNNGIVDHRDYLTWGVMKGATGAKRDGLISWRGHYCDDWDELVTGLNIKHGDGDGNGIVDINDIDINTENFLLTNQNYQSDVVYTDGPEIVLSAQQMMDDQGRIRNFRIQAGESLNNVLGIAFEIEFDTSQFQLQSLIEDWPDSHELIYKSRYDTDHFFKIAIVQTNHKGITIGSSFLLLRDLGNILSLKPGLPIPDSTVIRLRNLIAIDPEGNEIKMGSNTLVVYKEIPTEISNPDEDLISLYPNPAQNVLYVDTPTDVSGEIINLQGQIIQRVYLKNISPIDVSGFSPGVYLLRISGSPHTYKVVIY